MFLIFCGPFFLGGLPHTKGVCILNIFYRISHFDTKWKNKKFQKIKKTRGSVFSILFIFLIRAIKKIK